jgi:hypothetical protein
MPFLGMCVLALLLQGAAPGRIHAAGTKPLVSKDSTSPTGVSPGPEPAAFSLTASWLGKIFGPLRSALGNRTRMVQLATVALVIGLGIMFSMGKNK